MSGGCGGSASWPGRIARRRPGAPLVLAVVAGLLLGSMSVAVGSPAGRVLGGEIVGAGSASPANRSGAPLPAALAPGALAGDPREIVADSPLDRVAPGSIPDPSLPLASLEILLTFRFANASTLDADLAALYDPASPAYRHFLSAAEFDARFSPSAALYDGAAGYLEQFHVSDLTLLPDRLALSFDASPQVAEEIFDTRIAAYSQGGQGYEAATVTPTLPAPLAAGVAEVEGLGTYSHLVITSNLGVALGSPQPSGEPEPAATPNGYLTPATYDGFQMEYAPDLQVAYNETGLFGTYGYPTSEDVATILWSGTYEGASGSPCRSLSDGEDVGPWVRADIDDFFNETMPSGEPHAAIYAVPIDGAPEPGPAAGCDSSGAQVENTLDLEMVGSMAPGASIYNVYGPEAEVAGLDEAFAAILSPPATLPASVRAGLENVSVISNSWGAGEENDSSWYESVVQAAARGISVLASSGDSDDNAASPKYTGTTIEFPSDMAFDDSGMTAVGGTTLVLDPTTLAVSSEVAWNISAADVDDDGPAGSTGGISTVFPEPSWQLSTEANDVLGGKGRGVPDLAAIANNTLMTLTIGGTQYRATNASLGDPFVYVWGTSIASPLVAGLLAEVDHALGAEGKGALGFLDPLAYALGNSEYLDESSVLPFRDITSGSNYLYHARVGYDLVTGWGSPDAGNLTRLAGGGTYPVTFAELGLPASTGWTVTVEGFPYSGTGATIAVNLSSGTYPFSVATGLAGYTAVPASGTAVVDDAALTVSVTFFDVPAPLANRSSVDVGQRLTFTSAAQGGSGTLTYAWEESDADLGCAFADASSIGCLPTHAGAYTVSVSVTDADAVTSATVVSEPLPVFARPAAPVPAGNVSGADVEQEVRFSITPAGGSGGTTYTWQPSSPELGCALDNLSSVVCRPTTAGTYGLRVKAVDSNGATNDSASLSFVVSTDPLGASPQPSRPTADAGQTVSFTASVAGGAGGGTYAWTFSAGLGCTASVSATVTCVPTAGGAFALSYRYVDANGFATGASTSYTVTADVGIASFVATPSTLLEGGLLELAVATTGGLAPLLYVYLGLPAGCGAAADADAASISCRPSAAGTFSLEVVVTDGNGYSADSNTTVHVGAVFLGLPAAEGYGLLAVAVALVAALVLAGALLYRRRKRAPPPPPPPA